MTITDSMSQSDLVVYRIKDMIIRGELSPNARLPVEKDLAESLNVSRGGLREGVRALSVLGILETRQGSGTFVTDLNPSMLLAPLSFVVDLQHADDAVNLHSARRVLETEAAGQAAKFITEEQIAQLDEVLGRFELALSMDPVDHQAILELDNEFHRIVAEASRNPILGALIAGLSSRTLRGRLLRALNDDRAEQAAFAEHRAIAAALREHAPDRAQLRMANHLLVVEDFLRQEPAPDFEASAGVSGE